MKEDNLSEGVVDSGLTESAQVSQTEAEDDVLRLKIVIIFMVALAAMFCFLPYLSCMKNRKHKSGSQDTGKYNNWRYICCSGGRIQSFSTAFASGMLMTMAFCHIMPETITSYDNLMKAEASGGHADHRLLLRLLAAEGADPHTDDDHAATDQ